MPHKTIVVLEFEESTGGGHFALRLPLKKLIGWGTIVPEFEENTGTHFATQDHSLQHKAIVLEIEIAEHHCSKLTIVLIAFEEVNWLVQTQDHCSRDRDCRDCRAPLLPLFQVRGEYRITLTLLCNTRPLF